MLWKVIQFQDPTGQIIVARVPREGTAELVSGTQLIVQEGQIAAFFHEGKPVDGFRAGRYNLTTQNLPVLSKILKVATLGTSPFRSYVYFVALKTFTDLGWGTTAPILFRDSEFKIVHLRAHGAFAIRIGDPKVFLHIGVRAQGIETSLALEEYLRKLIVSRLAQILPEVMTTVLDLPRQYQEIAIRMKKAVRADFEQYGIALVDLLIEAITLPPAVQEAIDRAARTQAVGADVVPNVVGMTQAAATAAITAVDSLTVGTVEQYNDTVIAGLVISQDPNGGTSVSPGSSVNLVISQGKPHVPDIVGKMAADANTVIVDANLVVGTVTADYNDTVAAGNVISQSPPAETVVAIGTDVNYVKSLGKPLVPNIVGMTVANANTTIKSVDNLKVGTVITEYSNTVAESRVISQNPAAGKAVTVSSKVKYIKSLGKPIVPNIVGKTDVNANKAITSIDNLKVGTVTTAYSNTVAAGKVISQSPTAGTAVMIGSSVDYKKSLGKPIMPNVVGMAAADANTAITSVDNLKVGTVITEYSNTVAEGRVISQNPAASKAVTVGSKVKYIKSLGKPIVPNIVGKTEVNANKAIKSVDNLKVGTVTTAYSNTVAAGKVIGQSPTAGTAVMIGSSVNYIKSLGKKS
jgi:beta-lactam-binding protein with PASTA domain